MDPVPRKPAEPDDPAVLVGREVPGDPDLMAACLVEEYVRQGWSDEALLRLFRSPFFAGTHALWRLHGEARIRQLIREARARWGWPRFTTDRHPEA